MWKLWLLRSFETGGLNTSTSHLLGIQWIWMAQSRFGYSLPHPSMVSVQSCSGRKPQGPYSLARGSRPSLWLPGIPERRRVLEVKGGCMAYLKPLCWPTSLSWTSHFLTEKRKVTEFVKLCTSVMKVFRYLNALSLPHYHLVWNYNKTTACFLKMSLPHGCNIEYRQAVSLSLIEKMGRDQICLVRHIYAL